MRVVDDFGCRCCGFRCCRCCSRHVMRESSTKCFLWDSFSALIVAYDVAVTPLHVMGLPNNAVFNGMLSGVSTDIAESTSEVRYAVLARAFRPLGRCPSVRCDTPALDYRGGLVKSQDTNHENTTNQGYNVLSLGQKNQDTG